MIRTLLEEFVIPLLLFLLVRSLLRGWFGARAARPPAPRRPVEQMPTATELKKDPVCGTYVSAASAFTPHGEWAIGLLLLERVPGPFRRITAAASGRRRVCDSIRRPNPDNRREPLSDRRCGSCRPGFIELPAQLKFQRVHAADELLVHLLD